MRTEFSSVPDDLWQVGRRNVLSSILGRGPIFVTAPAVGRWESAARVNVQRELSQFTPVVLLGSGRGCSVRAGHRPARVWRGSLGRSRACLDACVELGGPVCEVEPPFGDPGAAGDVLERGGRHAFGEEQFPARFEQVGAPLFGGLG